MSKQAFLINSLTHGGSEKVITLLLTALQKEGLEIELICLEKNTVQKLPQNIKITYLSDLNGTESPLIKIIWLPILVFRFLRYLAKNDIKVVQSHIFRANYVNLLSSRFNRSYTVQIVDVISVDYFQDQTFSGALNLFLIRRLYNYADLIIFKAEQMRRNLLKFMPLLAKTTIINNPYDIQAIQTCAQEAIEDFHFNKERQYVVTVGRLSKQKNQMMLIDTLHHLHVNTELIIIGDGEEKHALERYIVSQSLCSRVHLLGAKSNPFKYISRADIFVLSSNQEGFPNVLVEAMLSKTPVISTDCISGPREILAPNTDLDTVLIGTIEKAAYGILTPVNDTLSLQKAIMLLLNDSALKEHYRLQAYERALSFSIETITKKYKEVLCAAL
jgi:N-acetylgalactosamine-N,N'-diacetylbacillosaminyl-diphospho-undecaprenol 4-alpha-N-acetylgalactosaminyltransferase